jgi:hypothetical protein
MDTQRSAVFKLIQSFENLPTKRDSLSETPSPAVLRPPEENINDDEDSSALPFDSSSIDLNGTSIRRVSNVPSTSTFEEIITHEPTTRPIRTTKTSITAKTSTRFILPTEAHLPESTETNLLVFSGSSPALETQLPSESSTFTSSVDYSTISDATTAAFTATGTIEDISSASTSSADPSATAEPVDSRQTLTNGATAAIVLASVAFVLALGLGLWLLYKRKMRTRFFEPFGLSPIIEPYDASYAPSYTPTTIGKPTLPTHLYSWATHHGPGAGIMPSSYLSSPAPLPPSFPSSNYVEMMSFTRPAREPRKMETGDHSMMTEASTIEARHNTLTSTQNTAQPSCIDRWS